MRRLASLSGVNYVTPDVGTLSVLPPLCVLIDWTEQQPPDAVGDAVNATLRLGGLARAGFDRALVRVIANAAGAAKGRPFLLQARNADGIASPPSFGPGDAAEMVVVVTDGLSRSYDLLLQAGARYTVVDTLKLDDSLDAQTIDSYSIEVYGVSS